MARILLGVGGGIAAYKAAILASQLVQRGHVLRVAMTSAAMEFVGPLTFEGICGSKVISSSTQVDADGGVPHIDATREVELVVIAPATAGLIARLAAGLCDDAVSLAALAARAPKLLCPAMNDAMWENPILQRNVASLESVGFRLLGPTIGHLAEGYDAVGRMAEPEVVLAEAEKILVEGGGA